MSRSAIQIKMSAFESGISRERRGASASPQASGVERGEGPPRLNNDVSIREWD